MSNKVDSYVRARIIELYHKQGLTQAVIAARLGIATRTVRLYLALERDKQEKACTTQE